MSSPFLRSLNQVARGAKSKADKGKILEEATKHFLTGDVQQQLRFDEVWLWNEYPENKGRRDTGVDLVAREHKNGRNNRNRMIAIQCKFYSSKKVGWKDISTFVASCSKVEFAAGILIITTKLTDDARLNLRDIPTIQVWRPERFDGSNINWDNWANQHRPEPSIEELFSDIRSGWHRPKPSIADIHVPPRPHPSQPDYGRRTRRYSASRSPDKKPSILSSNLTRIPLGIIAIIISITAPITFSMLFTRVDEVVERAVVGVPVAVSMLLTRAESALKIIVAIVVVLGIFALSGAFRRR